MVLVAPGVYDEAVSVPIDSLTLSSEVIGEATVRHAAFGPVIFASGNSFRMTGFRVEKLTAAIGGRTIDLRGSDFEISDCTIVRGDPGFLLFEAQGSVIRCTVRQCFLGLHAYGSTVSITDCDVVDNAGSFGGISAGVYISGNNISTESDVTMLNCRLLRNSASLSGAAIFIEGPTPAELEPSRLVLEYCTLSDNMAGLGAAIAIRDAEVAVRHCTIVRNRVTDEEGGVIDVEDISSRSVIVANTILAFNDGPAFVCHALPAPVVSCSDLFGNTSDAICGQDAGKNFSLDPAFCDLDGGNLYLQENSPCSPNHSPGACGLIGAYDPGCVNPVMDTTWGAVKRRYAPQRR